MSERPPEIDVHDERNIHGENVPNPAQRAVLIGFLRKVTEEIPEVTRIDLGELNSKRIRDVYVILKDSKNSDANSLKVHQIMEKFCEGKSETAGILGYQVAVTENEFSEVVQDLKIGEIVPYWQRPKQVQSEVR